MAPTPIQAEPLPERSSRRLLFRIRPGPLYQFVLDAFGIIGVTPQGPPVTRFQRPIFEPILLTDDSLFGH